MSDKSSFTFRSFSNGLSNDPTKWKTHGYYSAGIDLIGLHGLGTSATGARPNTLQLAQQLDRDTISSAFLTGFPEWITRNGAGDYYAFIPDISSGGEGLLMVNSVNSNTWTSAKYTSATSGGGGLITFNDDLYWGQDAKLGRFTGATYANNFATFTSTLQQPRPMKVFAGVLNIGNGKYIATVDASATFSATALTLPTDFIIRSLEVMGNYLVIAADNRFFTRIFLWTGGTATYQEFYDLPEAKAPILVAKDGKVFAIGTDIYQLGEVGYRTLSPSWYGQPAPAKGRTTTELGAQIIRIGSTGIFRNQLIYGVSETFGALTNADQAGGVWMFGQYDATYPLQTSLHFLLPNQISGSNYTYAPNNIQVGGIYSTPTDILKIGFQDLGASALSAKYGFASMQSSYSATVSNYTNYITLPLDMDSDSKKLFHSIRLNFTGDSSNAVGLSVYYRLNTNFDSNEGNLGNWTLLKTLTSTDTNSLLPIPIRKYGRNIMFKFLLTANDTTLNLTPQVLEYTVLYEPLNPYR